MPARRPSPLLLAAAVAAGLAVTGVLAHLVPVAQRHDVATLNGFLDLNRPRLEPLLSAIGHLADPVPYALSGAALSLLALARGHRRTALAIPAILVASGATTEALKHLTASPRYDGWLGDEQIAAASWPSGHATAAMAVGVCAVLAAPPRWRTAAAAAGGIYALAVAFSILALGWHFPSDVLGGFLVATLYGLLAIAALARRSSAAR